MSWIKCELVGEKGGKRTNRALLKPANTALFKLATLCPCRVCGRACAEQSVCLSHAQTRCTEMEEKQAGHAMCHICSYMLPL